MAAAVVAFAVIDMGLLPAIERLVGVVGSVSFSICIIGGSHTARSHVGMIACGAVITEVHVAGQCAEIIHNVVDAEVVTVDGSGGIQVLSFLVSCGIFLFIAGYYRLYLVE